MRGFKFRRPGATPERAGKADPARGQAISRQNPFKPLSLKYRAGCGFDGPMAEGANHK